MSIGKIFKGDRVIWVVFLLLSIISLVAVYSSIGLYAYSIREHETHPTDLFLKHLGIVLSTYVAVLLLSRVNYRYFSRFAMLGYWVSLVLLGVMYVLKLRWFRIPGLGQFQPSEIAKVVLVIFVARMLALNKDHLSELGVFVRILIFIAPVVGLILPQNFSTAALVFIPCFLVMYFGGVNRKYWWEVMVAGMLLVGAYLFINYNRYDRSLLLQQNETVEYTIERERTWGHRIYSWIHPNPDELSQENMSRMAIARGKVIGVGVGNTVHARLMTQAHNDFIYAIIIEETGMVGGLVVFVLYSIFYFRCIRLAWRCKGRFGALTVAGLGTMIYLQALVNMSVAVGALPVTGQTLPLISYGGTAFLFTGCAVGVIQSIAADTNSQEREVDPSDNKKETEVEI